MERELEEWRDGVEVELKVWVILQTKCRGSFISSVCVFVCVREYAATCLCTHV